MWLGSSAVLVPCKALRLSQSPFRRPPGNRHRFFSLKTAERQSPLLFPNQSEQINPRQVGGILLYSRAPPQAW